MTNGNKYLYEFGSFRIDPEERVLLRDGEAVALPPKAFDTLVLLVRNSGRVLDKNVLMKELWPETFVEEANLAQHISLVRKALGESPTEPQYVETIPRRGYRFLAKVEQRPQPAERAPAEPVEPKIARERRFRFVCLVAALAVILAIGVTLLSRTGPDLSNYRLTPLITEAGAETAPAWSPDGRTLAYLGDFNGIQQVFTRSIDASASTRITNSAANCSVPFWSPDGRRIYYVSQSKLWSVSAAGGAPQSALDDVTSAAISPDGKTLVFARGRIGNASLGLFTLPAGEQRGYAHAPFSQKLASISPPQFSPDGAKIAVVFARAAGAAEPELWILPYPTGAPKRVASSLPWAAFTIRRFNWMPDSRHIAYAGQGRFGDSHLYRIDTQNGLMEPLTATTADQIDPAVSPDGTRIAFGSGATDFDAVEISLEGTAVRSLLATSRSERMPAWSPSGSQIAYVTNAAGPSEIWLRDLDDGSSRPLARIGQSLTWNRVDRPRFSPDGSRIAYDVYGEKHVIAISNIAGGSPVILDSESPDQHGPSWSPDGAWIAYRRLMAGSWQLVKAPVGGGEPVSLGETHPFGGSETDWSPAGEWICHRKDTQLYLVSADGKVQKSLKTSGEAFGFSPNGASLYVVRQRTGTRHWELAEFTVPEAKEKSIRSLDIPREAEVAGFNVNRTRRSFATSIGFARYDIWLLEGFHKPHSWRRW